MDISHMQTGKGFLILVPNRHTWAFEIGTSDQSLFYSEEQSVLRHKLAAMKNSF